MVILFTSTIFISAFLLFLIQPIVGKLLLPFFGGTPAVWNTCMVFFQITLLAGYAWSHFTIKFLEIRKQLILQMILFISVLFTLPIAFATDTIPSVEFPVLWLFTHLGIAFALPFFAISTCGPLIQNWFSSTDHPDRKNPYFLYSASNTGSLIALLGYPFLFESSFSLNTQSRIWSFGYGLLCLLLLYCAISVFKSSNHVKDDQIILSNEKPNWDTRLWWIFLAFVPSSLMHGVTTHITTNLASVPQLWIIPLALYLLSFIIVFSNKPILPHRIIVKIIPYLFIPTVPLFFMELKSYQWVFIIIHLILFFFAAMLCHGELSNRRPEVFYLTKFYLFMAIGGALGGIYNAILAPIIYSSIIEYQIAIVLACLALPYLKNCKSGIPNKKDFIYPCSQFITGIIIVLFLQKININNNHLFSFISLIVPGLICFSFKSRPLRFTLGFGVIFLIIGYQTYLNSEKLIHMERNFFGVKTIVEKQQNKLRKLFHGTTIHGIQSTEKLKRQDPLAYFHKTGPLGDVFASITPSKVGIIGLGIGSMAYYCNEGQTFTFYEIDLSVTKIALNKKYFVFLDQCKGKFKIVSGDGRLEMKNTPGHHYDLLILDAFSSDAIPSHLITVEAIKLYFQKLTKEGIMLFHISNRYLELEELLAAIAKKANLASLVKTDKLISKKLKLEGKYPSKYFAMARKSETLEFLKQKEWKKPLNKPGVKAWTDQYSNILTLINWK